MVFVVFGLAVALVVIVNVAGRWSRKPTIAPLVEVEPLHQDALGEAAERAIVAADVPPTTKRGEYRPYSLEEVERLSEQRTRTVEILKPKRRALSDAERFAPARRDTGLTYHISYASEWGEVTERRISVKRVYWDHGSIYVEAYCC